MLRQMTSKIVFTLPRPSTDVSGKISLQRTAPSSPNDVLDYGPRLRQLMRRRNFIGGMASCAAWPLAAQAQERAMPVIGVLYGVSAADRTEHMAAFRRALTEIGFVYGRTVAIE